MKLRCNPECLILREDDGRISATNPESLGQVGRIILLVASG